jgi:hypothetical protein
MWSTAREATNPSDTFRHTLQETISALEEWAQQMGPAAQVERSTDETNWRLRLLPPVRNACACELILRRDQRFDITIGEESYQGLPIASPSLFLPLLQAVAAGDVVTRHWVSSTTGLEYSVETVVSLPDGSTWRGERRNPLAPEPFEPNLECEAHYYVPYFRT